MGFSHYGASMFILSSPSELVHLTIQCKPSHRRGLPACWVDASGKRSLCIEHILSPFFFLVVFSWYIPSPWAIMNNYLWISGIRYLFIKCAPTDLYQVTVFGTNSLIHLFCVFINNLYLMFLQEHIFSLTTGICIVLHRTILKPNRFWLFKYWYGFVNGNQGIFEPQQILYTSKYRAQI